MYARRRSASNVGRGDGAKLGRGDGALERGVGGERRPEAIVVVVVAMSKPVTMDADKRQREETRADHGCRRPPHHARRVTAEDGRLPDLDIGACLVLCSSTWSLDPATQRTHRRARASCGLSLYLRRALGSCALSLGS